MAEFERCFSNKPISSDAFTAIGVRPEPVVPDGVWIEIQGHQLAHEALCNAVAEETRDDALWQYKHEQLRKFKRDVQKRVALASQYHKQLLRDSHSVKMEKERELLLRSASAAELSTPKKNRCSYNANTISIVESQDKLKYSEIHTNMNNLCLGPTNKGDPALLICQKPEVNHLADNARKHLAERTVIPLVSDSIDKPQGIYKSDHLPGGIWGVGSSRDKCGARSYNISPSSDPNVSNDDENLLLETVSASSDSENIILDTIQASISTCLSSAGNVIPESKLPDETTHCVKPNVSFKLSEDPTEPCDDDDKQKGKIKLVTRSLPSNIGEDVCYCTNGVATAPKLPHSNEQLNEDAPLGRIPPLVNPGAIAHNLKMADERAKWLSRRVFADAEREQSKEHSRWKEHRQRVARLKEEKERVRAIVEGKSREQVDAVAKAKQQLQMEIELKEEKRQRRREQMHQKKQKTERFIAALYSQLRNRVAQNKIELPPLCMCGSTFWDTNPQTCANNCLFYCNYKAYARALEAVLAIVERQTTTSTCKDLQKSTVSLGLVDEEVDDVDAEPALLESLSSRSISSSSRSHSD